MLKTIAHKLAKGLFMQFEYACSRLKEIPADIPYTIEKTLSP
jgi:hypothetical protein